MRYLNALKYCLLAAAIAVVSSFVVTEENVEGLGKSFTVPEQRQSVVRIGVELPSGVSDHGSGVLIRSDLALTNHHVVRERGKKGRVTVTFKGGLTREATVLKESKVWDVALLQFDSVLLVPARPADKPARRQQEVTICGFPGNGDYEERSGRVVGFRGPNPTSPQNWFVVNNRCESGMSGGPVFDDNGEVVGILFGSLRFANCVGLDALKEFIHVQPIPRQDRTQDNPTPTR